MLTERGITYEEVIRLEDSIARLDLLYMTRVQRERLMVSDTLSPLEAEEEPASEKPSTCPPRFSMA